MAISDIYSARAAQTIASTSQTLGLFVYGGTTHRAWIVGVRMEVESAGSTPAGNQVLFQLARSGNTPNVASASATVTPVAQDFSAPASITTAYSAGTGMTTAPTFGNVLADWTLPQTSGSAWEEFPPLGYEWGVGIGSGANAGVGLWITQANSTSTTYVVEFIFSE